MSSHSTGIKVLGPFLILLLLYYRSVPGLVSAFEVGCVSSVIVRGKQRPSRKEKIK